ncbi:MAG: glycosyltransferase family 4 protein [Anaerolineae bacterium]
MRPTIAYILKMYPRFSETFIVNEILELERQGVDVRIYSLRKPDDGRFHAKLAKVKANVVYVPQYPQLEIRRIQEAHTFLAQAQPTRYQEVRTQAERRGHDAAIKRFLQAGYIAAHLLRHPVDATHAHFASSATRVANLVYHLSGIPYSFTAHAKDIFHETVKPESLRGKIRDARFVVTVSRFNKAYLSRLMNNEPADIRCLYNGIDLKRFHPGADSRRSGNLILGVGRLVEKKGFDILIRACGILQDMGVDFRCDIIGKGDLHEVLSRLITTLNLQSQVYLLGPKPQDQVQQAYKRAAIFALPCVIGADGNRDGLPTVLLEAMASGLPVVSTRLTGNPEIIDDGVNGRLVPPGDAVELAYALADLLRNNSRRRQMAAEARLKVERVFDVRQNVAQLHQWLTEPAQIVPAPTTEPAAAWIPVSQFPTPSLQEVLVTL